MTTPTTPTSPGVVAAPAMGHARPVFDKTERGWLEVMISDISATDREHDEERIEVQGKHDAKEAEMRKEYGDDLNDCMVPLTEKMALLEMQHRLKELERSTTFNAKLKQLYEQALHGSISTAALPAQATGSSTGAAVPLTGAVGASLSVQPNPNPTLAPPSGDPGDGNEGKGGGLVTQGLSAGAAATDTEAGVGMKRVREDGVGAREDGMKRAREDGKTEEEPAPGEKPRVVTDAELYKHLKNTEPPQWNFKWSQAKAKAKAANDEKAEDAPKMTIWQALYAIDPVMATLP